MKKILLGALVALALIGCGGEVEDRIEDKLATKAEDAIDAVLPDEAIEEIVTDDETLSQTEREFYGIGLNLPPLNSWTTGITENGMTEYFISDEYFDGVSAIVMDGLVQRVILQKVTYNDDYGIASIRYFNSFDTKLNEDYNLTNNFDFCTGSEWMCESGNYSKALYNNERYKLKTYSNNEDIIGISLQGAGGYNITLAITYETKEYYDFKEAYENEAIGNL